MSTTPIRQPQDAPGWDAHKESLRVMWLEENNKLDQIMKFMSSFHGFHAE
jgi:hypothetical protein